MTAAQLRTQLKELQAERALASLEGLAHNHEYMADLDREVLSTRSAYVGAVVTEIAAFRAELCGCQVG